MKEAALKAAEQLNFDEMARNDEYIHQEGLNVVRKGEKKKAAPIPSQEIDQSSLLTSIERRTQESLLESTKGLPSSAHSLASSTRSVASMRQHSSLGSSVLSDLDEEGPHRLENDDTSEDEGENVVRKNKLRFLEDLDHRLSKPNQELELMPQHTKMNTATPSISDSVSTGSALWASPNRNSNKKQPLWVKPARSQPQSKPTEDLEPLIVTTTTSSAVLDDSEMQALVALQQQSSASSASFIFRFMPSFLISWCSGIIPSIRQYPKITVLVFLVFLFYLLRAYIRLAIPVEGGSSSASTP